MPSNEQIRKRKRKLKNYLIKLRKDRINFINFMYFKFIKENNDLSKAFSFDSVFDENDT